MTVLVAAACAEAPRDPATMDASIRSVQLADSVVFTNELIGTGYLYRIAVTTAAGIDTLEGVLSAQEPVIAGDTAIHGLRYEQDRITGGFRYTPAIGVEPIPLPENLYEYSTPRFAPGGRHLAYLARDSTGLGYAAVATFPSGHVIYRGPRVRMLETDAPVSGVTWSDSTHFEVRIERSHRLGGILRVRGTLDSAAVIDTIPSAADRP